MKSLQANTMRPIFLILVPCCSSLAHATPCMEETPTGKEILARLVGSWSSGKGTDFAISQNCEWILNRKYLEIETTIDIAGQPKSNWRTLLSYDSANDSYQLWNFSDDGVVTTERGTWNSKSKRIDFKGRTSNDRESFSSLSLLGKGSMERDVNVFVGDDRKVLSCVAFVLERVSTSASKQLTKP